MGERIERWDIDRDLIPGYEIIVGHTPTIPLWTAV